MYLFKLLTVSILCLMTLVSPAVAAKLTVPPAEAVEPLPPGTETRPLSFTKLVARLNRGQTWGQVQIGVMCLPAGNMTWRGGQSQVDTGELDVVFFEEIEKAGFSSTGNPNLLFEREDNSQAEYLVAGAIKSASARLCYKLAGFGDYDTVNGEVIFEVEWQIYSRINKTVVAQITTRGGALRKESASGGANVLFDIAFSENVKAWQPFLAIRRTSAAAFSGSNSGSSPQGMKRPGYAAHHSSTCQSLYAWIMISLTFRSGPWLRT